MLKSFSKLTFNQSLMAIAGGLAGIGGSLAMTALLGLAALWSLAGLVTRRLAFRITRTDLALLVPCTLFVAVQVLFAVINAHDYFGDNAYLVRFMGPLVLFLLPWLIIPRLRQPEFDSLDMLTLGASVCLIFPLPLAWYQVFINEDRATGVTGNALPFALICAVFSVLSLFNLLSPARWRHPLGWAGSIIGIFCLLLSGSIGLLPVAIPAAILFFVIYRQHFVYLYTRRNMIIGGIVLALFALAAAQWAKRLVIMIQFMINPDGSKKFRTYNFRLEMWDAAVDLIKHRPLLGYGMENRVAYLHQKTGLEFVQFHNGFLTAWVDSGIAGVVATALLLATPLLMAWQAPKDVNYGKRMYIAAYLTAIYFVGGMSYVFFMDLVYDSVFLWIVIAIAVSIPVSKANPLRF